MKPMCFEFREHSSQTASGHNLLNFYNVVYNSKRSDSEARDDNFVVKTHSRKTKYAFFTPQIWDILF